jgi:hypothetical protein
VEGRIAPQTAHADESKTVSTCLRSSTPASKEPEEKDFRIPWAGVFDRSAQLDGATSVVVFMERILKFDIFSGAIDKNARWLEVVEGLENAKWRMDKISTKSPGRYFVFCDFSHTVVALTDTFSEMASKERATARTYESRGA